jgi:hypothetical protein
MMVARQLAGPVYCFLHPFFGVQLRFGEANSGFKRGKCAKNANSEEASARVERSLHPSCCEVCTEAHSYNLHRMPLKPMLRKWSLQPREQLSKLALPED